MTTATITKTETIKACCECAATEDLTGTWCHVGGIGEVMIYRCESCLQSSLEASLQAVKLLRDKLGK